MCVCDGGDGGGVINEIDDFAIIIVWKRNRLEKIETVRLMIFSRQVINV